MIRTATHRPRLLVVDDHRDGAEAISIFLTLSGYDTQYVLGGPEVLGALTVSVPEIAVLDINTAGMDGFAVARLLRQDWRTRHILMLAFTSQDESAVRKDSIASCFDGYCQKGGAPESLLHLFDQMSR
jgi:CheY-like chemotaxis protein